MFLIGVYNIIAIDIYPTAVSGLGNGFMRAMGILGVAISPNYIITDNDHSLKHFLILVASVFSIVLIQIWLIGEKSDKKNKPYELTPEQIKEL
jgi:sugar phosphate permease